MTDKEAIDKLKMWHSMMNSVENPDNMHLDNMAVILIAIKALKQQSSDDCISRAEVQSLIATWLSDYLTDETRLALEIIDGKVGDMPSVTPQRPQGRWNATENEEMNIVGYYCSCCDLPMETEEKTKYCPNCGADMSGDVESEEQE